jgi:hypothetical protein
MSNSLQLPHIIFLCLELVKRVDIGWDLSGIPAWFFDDSVPSSDLIFPVALTEIQKGNKKTSKQEQGAYHKNIFAKNRT